MTCASCDTSGTIRTRHLRMVRGSTFVFTHVSKDDLCRPRDLTGATVYVAIRADVKCDPHVKLTSADPAPNGWRTGIVIEDQANKRGQVTVKIIPEDTENLAALGHDDPWLYDMLIVTQDGSRIREIATSNLDLYPQVTEIPA